MTKLVNTRYGAVIHSNLNSFQPVTPKYGRGISSGPLGNGLAFTFAGSTPAPVRQKQVIRKK